MAVLHGNAFSARSVTETVVNAAGNSWTALPTTAMAGRAYVEVYNKGEHKLYLSFDNTASIKHRYAIGGGEMRGFAIQSNLTLYGRGHSGSTRVIVTEYK